MYPLGSFGVVLASSRRHDWGWEEVGGGVYGVRSRSEGSRQMLGYAGDIWQRNASRFACEKVSIFYYWYTVKLPNANFHAL